MHNETSELSASGRSVSRPVCLSVCLSACLSPLLSAITPGYQKVIHTVTAATNTVKTTEPVEHWHMSNVRVEYFTLREGRHTEPRVTASDGQGVHRRARVLTRRGLRSDYFNPEPIKRTQGIRRKLNTPPIRVGFHARTHIHTQHIRTHTQVRHRCLEDWRASSVKRNKQ